MSAKWHGKNWIRPERRLAIHIRDGFTCAYCGCDLRNAGPGEVSLDHLVPRSEGGGNETSNLVTACRSCNSSRQDRPWRNYATGGAIVRIEAWILMPINLALAKALIAGTAGDPEVEDQR